jgi:hypothetical protein
MKTKRKFVNVIPKNNNAKEFFVNHMNSLHGMIVEQETNNQYFVVSINRKYCFWLNKDNDSNWEIVK